MIDRRTSPDVVRFDGTNVTAVLGPTNTGKTFYAIERMIAHSSGVIGLPLRLLAREVYTRLVERVGVSQVALVTGEEKIRPPNARFHVCTVEAMPQKTDAAFVAIDEVQLGADLERGHVFTDRILHTRGREETLLLGASTMRGVLERLLSGATFVTRPRMSQLLYAGSKKTTRLPRRSAIVAFSADEVYAIAELVRRQRGGAAVVLGALSPRTRNSQVELYQSGEVDFLIATDAIGMGLNLDVDHVAFAQDWKFDGFQYRQLNVAELGQIAGRAGRHVRDGTFGVTGQVDPFAPEVVEALESHSFPPVRNLQWRSSALDFSSVRALRDSLDAPAPVPELTRSLPAVDQRALEQVVQDKGVAERASGAARVALLWEACKLPDYRRIAPAQHAEIIATIYRDLADNGHVAEDYMAAEVQRADRMEGDIDTLSRRIAEIRTWTYISHRPDWLADPTHWQQKTRDIEDRLSDALHERLTKRFVDRRTSVLMKRLREKALMEAEIAADGRVTVEGHHVGELQGFRFSPDSHAEGPDAKAIRAAAQKGLGSEFEARAERFANAPNGDLALGSDALLRWLGAPIAMLTAGESPLKPRLVLFADEQLTGPARDKVMNRADRYVTFQVSTLLKPLADLQGAEELSGTARGIAYRLVENFGLLQRREVAEEIRSLDQEARAALRRHGVRFGAYHIFIPALVKPAPANLMTLLWAIAHDGREKPGFGDVTQLLATGRTSAVADAGFDPVFYALAGYRLLGRRAVRVDILERLADLIRPALAWKPGAAKRPEGGYDGSQFIATPAMMSILGATADDMEEILKGLGYRSQGVDAEEVTKTLARLDDEAARAALAAKAEAAAAVATASSPEADETPAASEAESVIATDEPASAETEVSAEDATTAEEVETASEPAGDAVPAETPAAEPASEAAEPADEAVEPVAEPVAAEPAPVAEAAELAPVEEPAEAEAAAVAPDGTAEDKPAEPPKLIQVWRPGGRHDGRSREGARHGNRPNHRQEAGAGHRSRRPHGQGGEAQGAPAEGQGAAPRRDEQRAFQKRPPFPKKGGDGEGRGAGNRPGGGERHRGRPEGERKPGGAPAGEPRRFDKPQGQPPKPRAIDPDSPFAKLAALRDKLGK
ncbi:DEAD/DEAH box helicase [Aureimonas endophytica]|uniref:DEAD/DEAH box helicase n=1 Tax=Aureimonas endophytica TaxID=2027858 RepID=A0A917EBE8_9HYPH|nr:helicase-related protein [Aureimonas endophytica]GGE21072.1 DEAD/DEAH box helicase [Aureimonas endophytica]